MSTENTYEKEIKYDKEKARKILMKIFECKETNTKKEEGEK